MTETTKRQRPSFMDQIGKFCQEGRDITQYLYQVPEDAGQRRRLDEILDAVLRESEKTKHRELPKIAAELKQVLAEPPSMQGVDALYAGFDRMTRLWGAARSGLF